MRRLELALLVAREAFLKRLRIALFPLVLVTLLVACERGGAPRLPRLAPGSVVLAFGDSLTHGTGVSAAQSYPTRLERRISRTVVGSGVPGEVTAEGVARLPGVLDRVRPALMILCHGGNDLLRRKGEAQAAENLRAMIREAKSRGIAVVLLGVPKPGVLSSPPKFYAEVAREFGLPYDGETLPAILGDRALKSDLIHPNAEGYERLAEAVAALLQSSGAL